MHLYVRVRPLGGMERDIYWEEVVGRASHAELHRTSAVVRVNDWQCPGEPKRTF